MHAMDEGFSPGVPNRPLFTARRRARRGSQLFAFVLVLLAVSGVAGGWYWLRRGGAAVDAPSPDAVAEAATGMAVEQPADAPLPRLAASDAAVRTLVGALSAHPELAAWLVTDDLVRRFVRSVVALARGSAPAEHVAFADPAEPFSVAGSGGQLRIADASYRRYDLMSGVFVSLDGPGLAKLYGRLHPLFEEAYAELGISEASFDEMMARAVGNVLAVQVPVRPLEVVAREGYYAFADARIEARTPAEKQLLRMGPDNARRVQAKVREVAGGAGIPLP